MRENDGTREYAASVSVHTLPHQTSTFRKSKQHFFLASEEKNSKREREEEEEKRGL